MDDFASSVETAFCIVPYLVEQRSSSTLSFVLYDWRFQYFDDLIDKLIIPTFNSKERNSRNSPSSGHRFASIPPCFRFEFLYWSEAVGLPGTFSRCIEWVGLFRDAKPPSSSRSSLYDTTSGPPRASLPPRHRSSTYVVVVVPRFLRERRPPTFAHPIIWLFLHFRMPKRPL